MKKEKLKFYVEPKGFPAQCAVILMGLAIVFRIVGCWGLWADRQFAVAQIALPIAAGLLFILLVLLLGKHALWTTSLPVLMGVVFFVIKSLTFESRLHTVLCILLYLTVAVLYVLTVFGVIRTKWLLIPLFGLPFLYHVFVEDLAALRDTAHPVTFAAGLQEISVLCIMLALLFLSIGIRRKKTELEDMELPKMKAPKVLAPQSAPAPAAEEPAAEKPVAEEPAAEEPAAEEPTAAEGPQPEPAEESPTEETI